MCPHKKAFVLSRGIVGDSKGEAKVACPLHKKTFSLLDGKSLQGEEYRIETFPVKVVGEEVFLELPPVEVLDELLATEIGCQLATSCQSAVERNGHSGVSLATPMTAPCAATQAMPEIAF
jgi:hypothetical protein